MTAKPKRRIAKEKTDYARRDIDIGTNVIGWPTVALKSVVRALTRMIEAA